MNENSSQATPAFSPKKGMWKLQQMPGIVSQLISCCLLRTFLCRTQKLAVSRNIFFQFTIYTIFDVLFELVVFILRPIFVSKDIGLISKRIAVNTFLLFAFSAKNQMIILKCHTSFFYTVFFRSITKKGELEIKVAPCTDENWF